MIECEVHGASEECYKCEIEHLAELNKKLKIEKALLLIEILSTASREILLLMKHEDPKLIAFLVESLTDNTGR